MASQRTTCTNLSDRAEDRRAGTRTSKLDLGLVVQEADHPSAMQQPCSRDRSRCIGIGGPSFTITARRLSLVRGADNLLHEIMSVQCALKGAP